MWYRSGLSETGHNPAAFARARSSADQDLVRSSTDSRALYSLAVLYDEAGDYETASSRSTPVLI